MPKNLKNHEDSQFSSTESQYVIYNQIYEDMRYYRETEWKKLAYISLFLLAIFSTLINLTAKETWSSTLTTIKSFKIIGIDPIQISVILIGLIGLWGFIVMVNIKMRFPPMFNDLRLLHKKWNFEIINPDYKSKRKIIGLGWLPYFYDLGILAWIPLLALLDITFLVILTEMNSIWWLLPLLLYIFFCSIVSLLALKLKLKQSKIIYD